MAEMYEYLIAFLIDSGAYELSISPTNANLFNSKSVFLPTLDQAETFKTIDGRTAQSPGKVQISPVLNPLDEKFCLPNFHMHVFPNEDKAVRIGTACADKIVLGNPFLLQADLTVAKFVAEE